MVTLDVAYMDAIPSPAMRTLAIALLILASAPAAPASARIHRPPLPGVMPAVIVADCPGADGEVSECYVPPGDADATGRPWPAGAVFTFDGDRFSIAHGLGHAFDWTMMDDGERSAFARLAGRGDQVWSYTFTDPAGHLLQSPASVAEAFADAYANCRLRHVVAPGRAWQAGYDYYPTARQHRRICGLIARAGRDAGTPPPLG